LSSAAGSRPRTARCSCRALEAARDALRTERRGGEGGSAEPPPTSAEALSAIADLALSAGGDGRSGGERHQVVVHVDQPAVSGAGEGGCELADGPAIAAERARRMACDASVVHVQEQDGETLSVGRKTRSVPPALRRALRRRDHGCRFPGCERHRFVDAHHLRHWAQGGETKLDNLVLLCRRHHRLVHEGGYSLERLPGSELRFRDPWGAPIPDSPRPPPGALDPLVQRNRSLRIDADTYHSGTGERMDLDLAVQALLSVRPPGRGPLSCRHRRLRPDEARLVPAAVRVAELVLVQRPDPPE
jgi:hypothetical protein